MPTASNAISNVDFSVVQTAVQRFVTANGAAKVTMNWQSSSDGRNISNMKITGGGFTSDLKYYAGSRTLYVNGTDKEKVGSTEVLN